MSFLSGLGGGLASGLGGAAGGGLGALMGKGGGSYNPLLGILGSQLFGGGGGESGGEAAAQPEAAKPNVAATGLGKLLGVDGAKISSIANSIGGGMNQIAQAGGAQGGYAAPPQTQMPAVNNHMQLLDPKILQELVRHFSGNSASGQIQ